MHVHKRVFPLHRGLPLLAALALLLLAGGRATAEGEPMLLEDGVARGLTLPAGGVFAGRIRVPEDAIALTVAACSPKPISLHLRHARPLATAPGTLADVSRVGADALKIARLSRDTPVQVKPGDWYIAVTGPAAAAGQPFEIVVFVDRPRGTPSVLPGTTEFTLPVHRDRAELRTFLPKLASRVTLTIEGAEDRGLRYRIDGPREYRRSGRAPQSIVLIRPEAPAGAYTLDISAPRGTRLPASIRVRATWSSDRAPAPAAGPTPLVRPGTTHTLVLGGSEPTARTVRIPVAADTGGIEIEARSPDGTDVDLYVRRGGPLAAGDQDADYFALSSSSVEHLSLGGIAGLAPGMLWCETVLVEGTGPVRVTLAVRRLPKDTRRRTWGAQDPPPLVPGRWVRGRVEAGAGGVTWYALNVPAGTRSFHAMVLEATAPLDLVFARRTDGSIMRRALTARVDERIDHTFNVPPDGRRLFLLGVMNRNALEKVVDYRVVFSLDRPPELPLGKVWPPLIGWQGRSPTVRAAAATVELTVRDNAGGSGTCVTPRGRILTCRHVLELSGKPGAIQRDRILVAFPATLDRPPVQSFFARVTYDDVRKDLALLEITTDVFGRPLPKDLALPWLPLGDSTALELGDPVTVFGYPSQGSERSRTPVILTRGSIAGLESVGGAPRWLKTDAWIGLGHSGGSLVDGGMRLVGIPAATLGRRQVLGLAVPVSLIPAKWKLRILQDQPR